MGRGLDHPPMPTDRGPSCICYVNIVRQTDRRQPRMNDFGLHIPSSGTFVFRTSVFSRPGQLITRKQDTYAFDSTV